MQNGKYQVICKILETEYDLDIVNEITPMLAELNDEYEPDNTIVVLLPSRKGTRIMVLRLGETKK